MGLQAKPQILKDYWSKMDFYNTPWFEKIMAIERFEVIHHTMLHVSDINEKKAEEKIEYASKTFSGCFSSFSKWL